MSAAATGRTATTPGTTAAAGTAQGPDVAAYTLRLADDALVLAQRNLIKTGRTPEQLIDVTIQPVIFLLLFTYVFGGAIAGGSQHDYLQFLLPGLLGQGIAMAAGLALAAKKMKTGNKTWVFCGDGDLEEGISHEVCSWAGAMKLDDLILIYDSNHITIEGDTALAMAGVKLNVIGEENVWKARPAIFIGNHQSSLDPVIMGSLLRRDFTGVSKAEAKYDPRMLAASLFLDPVFIDRSNSGQSREALDALTARITSSPARSPTQRR